MTKGIVFMHGGREVGKFAVIEKMISKRIKANPNLVIMRYRNGQVYIEKPVKQVVRKKLVRL